MVCMPAISAFMGPRRTITTTKTSQPYRGTNYIPVQGMLLMDSFTGIAVSSVQTRSQLGFQCIQKEKSFSLKKEAPTCKDGAGEISSE